MLDVLDRDGQLRQTFSVTAWPLRIGRALDNDVVLADPHVAPQHLRIEAGATGPRLSVGDTKNGVQLGTLTLRSGEQRELPDTGAAIELTVGRTALRLRLPGHSVAAELPLATARPRRRHLAQIGVAACVLLAGMLFNTWLDTDPDGFVRAAASMLIGSVGGAAVWCGLWALLSKTFTRQGRFGWHLRVFLFASCAWLVSGALPYLLGFALSWAWPGDFAFVASYAVAAAALYFHLLAVEPARPRLMRSVAVVAGIVGVGLTLWTNQQRSDRLGDELYMSHLFPPAVRLAKPVGIDRFIGGAVALQARLDKKAKEPAGGDAGGGGEDE